MRWQTASVRWSDDASGSWTFTKKYPWSSFGRKPAGSFLPSRPQRTTKPTRIPTLTITFRTRWRERPT